MTAQNLIVQPQASYLITDTAHYLADGTVVMFGPKTSELHFGDPVFGPPASAVYSLTGCLGTEHINPLLQHASLRDMNDVVAVLPEVMRLATKMAREAKRFDGVHTGNAIAMAIAGYDRILDRSYGLFITNECTLQVEKGYCDPYKVVSMSVLKQGQGNFLFEGVNLADPAQFDPVKQGGELLDSQRLDPWDDDDGKKFVGVGGQGIVTEVTPHRINYHIVRNWPDRVGKKIDCSLANELAA
jgi:hypothetical protein